MTASNQTQQTPTPGPWTTALLMNDVCHVIPAAHAKRRIGGSSDEDEDRDDFARIVCSCATDRHGRDSHTANARLISAAPDLLAAVQFAKNILYLLTPEVSALGMRSYLIHEKIAAALAKAGVTP